MCAITLKRSSESSSNSCQTSNKRPRIISSIQAKSMIMSALPDRLAKCSATTVASPESILLQRLETKVVIQSSLSESLQTSFFQAPTAEEIAAYDHDSLAAIRNQDMTTLRQFHAQGRPLKCSNQFGESLLHMACRKGMVEVTTFLVEEASVPFAVCDDYGRTPLHDACWAHTTNFELVDLILTQCPDLLYMEDKRGNTPLSYLKQQKWAAWAAYLESKPASFFQPRHTAVLSQ